jgi:hypothetical protein
MSKSGEYNFLESWTLKITIVTAIITPTAAAVSAYFKLDTKIQEREAVVVQRISAIELDSNRSFADKSELKEMQKDIKEMRSDISEIKVLMKRGR